MKSAIYKRPTLRGFTLVELLVVVAIIGVLMAILVPALGRARAASTRVVCASNMRQIILATANYAAGFKGYLPPYVGYPNDYTVSNGYHKDNLKPLFTAKMLTTEKVRFCPTGPEGEFFGGRANYQFNPHQAIHAKQPGKSTWRYSKLQAIPKDRLLIMDMVYDQTTVSHWDKNGNATWNVGFADGHVNIVTQKDLYNTLKTRPTATHWGRLNDYVRVLELQATGQDPKLGKGTYQWNNYDIPIPTQYP